MTTASQTAAPAPIRDPFYSSPEWREFAALIRERDGERCTVGRFLSGGCSGTLHVNHIVPRREAPHRQFDPDNCGTACASHHPQWEALVRAIREHRSKKLPRCRHQHRTREGREQCERRLARQRGLFVVA